MSWKVTVRQGSNVGREKFDGLDAALTEARHQVDEVRRSDGLPGISMLKEFTPADRVHARIEISGPGLFRGREGGIDVMGDGHAIAYTGAIRKEPIAADSLDQAFDRLGRALGE